MRPSRCSTHVPGVQPHTGTHPRTVGAALAIVLLVALTLVIETASAAARPQAPAPRLAAAPTLSEYPISQEGDAAGPPATDGVSVVWSDNRNGVFNAFGWDFIHGAWPLGVGEGEDRTDPVVDGSLASYVYRSAGMIIVIDRSDPIPGAIALPFLSATEVDIDGDLIVWTDTDDPGDSNIEAYDVSTYDYFIVCDAPGDQSAPAVSDGVIVWQDRRSSSALYGEAQSDIYGYDVASGQEFPISTTVGDKTAPDIFGGVVVWEFASPATNRSDIYARFLWEDGGRAFPVCTDPGAQRAPSVSGSWIVWEDRGSAAGADIKGFDLISGRPFVVCDQAGDQTTPSTAGSTVVWKDQRDGQDRPAIYRAVISDPGGGSSEPAVASQWTDNAVVPLFLSLLPEADSSSTVRFSLDGVTWSDWQSLDSIETFQLTGGDGVKTVYIQLLADDGTELPPVTATINLDTHGPRAIAAVPCVGLTGRTATLKYRIRDRLSPKATVVIRIRRHGALVKEFSLGRRDTGRNLIKRFACDLARGNYRFSVYATDLAGNSQVSIGRNTLVVR